MSTPDTTAQKVTQAAEAERRAAEKSKQAMQILNKQVERMRRVVCVLGVLVIVLMAGMVANSWVAVRNAQSTIALCELRVASLRDSAEKRRQVARTLVPGPDLQERRRIQLAAARDLEHQADVARCQQRFQLP